MPLEENIDSVQEETPVSDQHGDAARDGGGTGAATEGEGTAAETDAEADASQDSPNKESEESTGETSSE